VVGLLAVADAFAAGALFLPLSAAAATAWRGVAWSRSVCRGCKNPALDFLRQDGPNIWQGLDAGNTRSRISVLVGIRVQISRIAEHTARVLGMVTPLTKHY
jgi:hypothetical protein